MEECVENIKRFEMLSTKFGPNILECFRLRDGSTFINHGSYGTVPKKVTDHQIRLLMEMESHPDDWFRNKVDKYLQQAISCVSEFLQTSPQDTVLIQNATKGVNTVLKSFPLKSLDAILITSLTYPAVRMAANAVTARLQGVECLTLDVRFPIESNDSICDQYQTCLDQHPNIKLAIIDHITSPSAVVMPVKRLVKLCHDRNVIVIIDGAHGPGQLPLNLPEIDADFYTGNFHKWVYTPRGCAFLWKNPAYQNAWLAPLVTSFYHGQGFQLEFGFEGTKDDTPCISVIEGIKFYHDIGGFESINCYNSTLVRRAADLLTSAWGTQKLLIPPCMESPNMINVQLLDIPGYLKTPGDEKHLMKDLYELYGIQTMTVCIQGELYIRISAQVYNCMQDYEKLCRAVLELRKRAQQ
ncbi:hypothetical protein CHS0354_033460 [Potamilus streckersoni]|uniref:Aminotransferase class V domain-containing protein n=1 Tax=Potamilus streckersoni TaxID=2493646 RepID=A0AAE0SHE2_9BIVA|nr:hypothetical protein CHS0354_033460 [Potamilus streckersoni]